MDDVLRHRQLAPHGLVLAPVVVVPLNHPLLVVLLQGMIGGGGGGVPHGLVLHGSGVAAVGGIQFLQIGLLHDVHLPDELFHLHQVHAVAGVHLELHGVVVNSHDVGDVGLVGDAQVGVVVYVRIPGGLHVGGGQIRAVAPVGSSLQLDGDGGVVVSPHPVAVSQQGVILAVGDVVHVQGLPHQLAGAGVAVTHSGVVGVGCHGVVGDGGAPLLAALVQALLAGIRTSGGALSRGLLSFFAGFGLVSGLAGLVSGLAGLRSAGLRSGSAAFTAAGAGRHTDDQRQGQQQCQNFAP